MIQFAEQATLVTDEAIEQVKLNLTKNIMRPNFCAIRRPRDELKSTIVIFENIVKYINRLKIFIFLPGNQPFVS